MTAFIIICVAMLVAALGWILWPLIRPTQSVDAKATRTERRSAIAVVLVVVSVLAFGSYAKLSNWDWKIDTSVAAQAASANSAGAAASPEVETMLKNLQAKLAADPGNVEGWLMLGRSNATLGRFPLALDAYQHALQLTNGENVEALVGLGEALAMTDESTLTGRAGELFSAALVRDPTHPKALWYGAISALRLGDLPLGRDRLALLLTRDPPQKMRDILEQQIRDIDAQIAEDTGGAPQTAAAPAAAKPAAPMAVAAPATAARSIRVSVSISPALQAQLKAPTPLFILARDPNGGGPPLAVQRHVSTELPLATELSEKDAMMPTRTIASVTRVQVVARVSLSGMPQAQSGDLFGQADYDFGKDGGTLNIMIDRTVP